MTTIENRDIAYDIWEDAILVYANHTNPDWAEMLEDYIPDESHFGLVSYILLGQMPGHFVTAVLEGDLFHALSRADDRSVKRLRDYSMFLWNGAPSGCFGSKEKVKDWAAKGGLIGGAA